MDMGISSHFWKTDKWACQKTPDATPYLEFVERGAPQNYHSSILTLSFIYLPGALPRKTARQGTSVCPRSFNSAVFPVHDAYVQNFRPMLWITFRPTSGSGLHFLFYCLHLCSSATRFWGINTSLSVLYQRYVFVYQLSAFTLSVGLLKASGHFKSFLARGKLDVMVWIVMCDLTIIDSSN